jgi:antitoxin (DNA-binding transcriptional repressor) of toxin-antitoxin stability system
MKKISVLQFRKNAKKIIKYAQQGQRMILTYRGKPVCRMEPFIDKDVSPDDPFYNIHQFATDKAENLDNKEIDRILYGK